MLARPPSQLSVRQSFPGPYSGGRGIQHASEQHAVTRTMTWVYEVQGPERVGMKVGGVIPKKRVLI